MLFIIYYKFSCIYFERPALGSPLTGPPFGPVTLVAYIYLYILKF